MKDIEDILEEKRAVDKENTDLQFMADGRGMSEKEMKEKEEQARARQESDLMLQLQYLTEELARCGHLLSKEEKLAKDQLDQKTTLEQDQEALTDAADEAAKRRSDNREELLKLQVKLSQLKAANQTDREDLEMTLKENAQLDEANAKLDEHNRKLDAEIIMVVKRVEVNSLLEDVDIEDLRLMAQNTNKMN